MAGGPRVALAIVRVLFAVAIVPSCTGSHQKPSNTLPPPGSKYSYLFVFGDSTVDSGWYRNIGGSPSPNATWTADWPAALAAGAGAPTSSPGLVYPQIVAAALGIRADPANQQGGTNYATSGAKNVDQNGATNGGFRAAIPTVTQITSYLSEYGGADPKALYLISSGGNDTGFATGIQGEGPYPADAAQYVTDAAIRLADAILLLKAQGAAHVVVANLTASFGSPAMQQVSATYNQALFSRLGAAVIVADIDSVRAKIRADPARYGFTSISNLDTACTQPAGIAAGWALLCSSSPAAPSTFASPDADQKLLFADDEHLATAGQKVLADYVLGLVQ